MLLRPVVDRPHGLRHGPILEVPEERNAENELLLQLTVLLEVVVDVRRGVESTPRIARRLHITAPRSERIADLPALFLRHGPTEPPAHDELEIVVVVDGHPGSSGDDVGIAG